MKVVELKPIRESSQEYEAIESELRLIFRREIYLPLLRELSEPKSIILNSKFSLIDAIRSGRIYYSIKGFFGKFTSAISKELRDLGAKCDQVKGSWKIPLTSLPIDIRTAVVVSAVKIKEKLVAVDKKLASLIPEHIAGKVSIEKIFDRILRKTENSFQETVRGIIVPAQLTPWRRAYLASEWQNNMKLWVKDFTEEEIKKLRGNIQKCTFSGIRYENIIQTIQRSYEVSQTKAKTLARQETSILLSKFKTARYTDSGIQEYTWGCVAGTEAHPVRPWHKDLEGKTFRFDSPPIISEPGKPVRRGNPGEDFGPCRCFPKPKVRFK